MSMKVSIEECIDWVLMYDEIETWFMWFMMRKWPDEMFNNDERDMCWNHEHESKCKMILA
jgi:hypothetical protein